MQLSVALCKLLNPLGQVVCIDLGMVKYLNNIHSNIFPHIGTFKIFDDWNCAHQQNLIRAETVQPTSVGRHDELVFPVGFPQAVVVVRRNRAIAYIAKGAVLKGMFNV